MDSPNFSAQDAQEWGDLEAHRLVLLGGQRQAQGSTVAAPPLPLQQVGRVSPELQYPHCYSVWSANMDKGTRGEGGQR
jgi:hypothetical protein